MESIKMLLLCLNRLAPQAHDCNDIILKQHYQSMADQKANLNAKIRNVFEWGELTVCGLRNGNYLVTTRNMYPGSPSWSPNFGPHELREKARLQIMIITEDEELCARISIDKICNGILYNV